MRCIVCQQIGTHQQQTDRALRGTGRGRQEICPLADPALDARVVDADIGIFDRRTYLECAPQPDPVAAGVAVHEIADQITHVFFRTGQPVLHCQEVSADVLRRARNEAQDLRQAAQHLHLVGAGCLRLVLGAAQFLQQRHGAGCGLRHIEAAHTCQLGHFGGRHAAHHGIARGAARFEGR
jgi:hypothetical protein